MVTTWRVYGRHTVACRLDRCDLPGLFRKKILLGPGEAAIILRDGESAGLAFGAALDQMSPLIITFRPQHEMPVVRHETVSEYPHGDDQ